MTMQWNLVRKLAVVGLGLLSGIAIAQSDLRETLFAQADAALAAANEARANVLAPKNYGEATENYRSAEDKLKRGRSIESIEKDLAAAAASLRKAVEATRLANVTFSSAIQARDDAEASNAAQFAGKQWRDAEERFASAAVRLENGNVNAARSRADDAVQLYRAAELTAIKANYLDETRRLIEQAKNDRVERYAPKTLAKAALLLGQAEKSLTDNRYDTDEPRSLAREAKYEAKHAIYLANTLKPVRDREVSLEDYALANERPIAQIASTLDQVAEFDQGFDTPTKSITMSIAGLQKEAYELSESRTQIIDLESEIHTARESAGHPVSTLGIAGRAAPPFPADRVYVQRRRSPNLHAGTECVGSPERTRLPVRQCPDRSTVLWVASQGPGRHPRDAE